MGLGRSGIGSINAIVGLASNAVRAGRRVGMRIRA
jgi:hypothetical protein